MNPINITRMKKQLFIDRVLQLGIKLCMLTGVAFTFACCYGPAPYHEEPLEEYWESQQKLEQRLSPSTTEQIANTEEPAD